MCVESHHLGVSASQPGDHQPGQGKVDKSLTARMSALKIAGESTAVRDPSIRAFHYPSPLKDMRIPWA